jgi:SAM-dependent methyltransferase
MLPYQLQVLEAFTKLLPGGATDILEIGSDIGGEVASALAQRTGARVVGINPSPEFPPRAPANTPNIRLLRADGRSMPFADRTFDAVLSVATLEHVNGLDAFLAEVARVLKPRGVFFTEFSPIWSSARGHHVYAVAGEKEARFWKPGKNPVPDYAHLLLTPDEMRAHLRSSPCTEELIEPIIQWIYLGDSINRCHFEAYMEAFRKCPLLIQRLGFGHDHPDGDTLARLRSRYGDHTDFRCSFISAVFRKSPEGAFQRFFFRSALRVRRSLGGFCSTQLSRMKFAWRVLASRLSR